MSSIIQNQERFLRKHLQNGCFFEKRHAQNLQNCVETHIQTKFFPNHCDQHISTDRGPNLCFQSIRACADECLDSQMLLDPLEKEFHLPTAAIQLGNCVCWQGKVVGQKNQPFLCLRVQESDATQTIGISLDRVEPLQQNRLIALNARRFVDFVRDHASELKVLLRPRDEESAGQSPAMQPREVQVSSAMT